LAFIKPEAVSLSFQYIQVTCGQITDLTLGNVFSKGIENLIPFLPGYGFPACLIHNGFPFS